MNIYNKSTIALFVRKHSDCKNQLELWYHDVSLKRWKSSKDVKRDFVTASIIGNNRVVFNVKGNKYRLIAAIDYQRGYVQIKFIGHIPNMIG
ncbi:type II toxin-antitoxin system HigB family toxin [soil metagenome]